MDAVVGLAKGLDDQGMLHIGMVVPRVYLGGSAP